MVKRKTHCSAGPARLAEEEEGRAAEGQVCLRLVTGAAAGLPAVAAGEQKQGDNSIEY